MRVYIVDSQPVFRAGIKYLLSQSGGWSVVGEADNHKELYEKLGDGDGTIGIGFDLIILDGEFETFTILQRLQERRPQGRPPFTLIVSGHWENIWAIQMLRSGANGYVHKSSSPQEISDAIRKVARGEKYITEKVADGLMSDWTRASRPSSISKREYQVLYLFASGLSLTDIAEKLGLSTKTVSTYRGRLLEKLGLNSSAQLIKYAIEQGLVRE
jgi:two-component system, NarL family, invasion response regulator UvrY